MSNLIQLVDARDWRTLFIEELGWNKPQLPAKSIVIDDFEWELVEVAQYKGVRIWVCEDKPDPREQRLIDREIKKLSTERLIIFAGPDSQEWRWPQSGDDSGRGKSRLVAHYHENGRENPALAQRLSMIEIKLDESPSLIEVLRRLRAAFDADKVTKTFFDKFKKEHEVLVRAIEGFPDYEPERTEVDKANLNQDRKWYSSLLLNRLMFIYFLQRKGFLDDDRNYLRNRLEAVRRLSGEGKFFEFYADFLLPMFHEGLGKSGKNIADPIIKKIVGDVPYINGGIFAIHELEKAYPDSHISDEIFESIFDLFDQYQWHLDDRASGNPNEINPDVLGHIFEQFVNQKQMGAYYTKEDVTYFMTSSTLLPVFLERVESQTGVNPWKYLQRDPDRYIWESKKYGYAEGNPYPREIEAERQKFPRPSWNEKAPENWGLPGETWWEVDHRHQQYSQLFERANNGKINNVDQAVTNNIDLETLALDVIDGLDSPADVGLVWNIITELKVIDPTCGSGAFLFAALRILESLYGAVLDAARSHSLSSSLETVTGLLHEVDIHPSQDYFVLKHATLNNLYGVDLMKEATEIARLRLFLKLVSAIEDRKDLEPLPDLDFNIKAGNALVGALTVDEVAFAADISNYQEILDQATTAADVVADAYASFRQASEAGVEQLTNTARKTLTSALSSARIAVNRTYFGDKSRTMTYEDWEKTHAPFHWFLEFPEVFASGGFDVVIGNPPYVARKKITEYEFSGFKTSNLPDIYAPCTERSAQITKPAGRMALILPISAQFSDRFHELRKFLSERFGEMHVSTFSRRPSSLFSGDIGVRSSIIIGSHSRPAGATINVTQTHRWFEEFRPHLFESINYVALGSSLSSSFGWMRLYSESFRELFENRAHEGRLGQIFVSRGTNQLRFKSTALYWLSVFLDDPPAYELDCKPIDQTKIGRLNVATETESKLALALSSSKLAFLWWMTVGDDFDVTGEVMKSLPVDVARISDDSKKLLVELAENLISNLPEHEMFTKYKGKWMGNYDFSEMRGLTDQIDGLLAREFGYEYLLPALEHAYFAAMKVTGDPTSTIRFDPCKAQAD